MQAHRRRYKSPACLCHDIALLSSRQVYVIRVVSRLRDNPKVRELLEETAGKPGTFAVSDEGVEAVESRRIAEWSRKDLDVGSLSQSTQTGGLLVRLMRIIEDCDAHMYLVDEWDRRHTTPASGA